jgi:hypothetical protein
VRYRKVAAEAKYLAFLEGRAPLALSMLALPVFLSHDCVCNILRPSYRFIVKSQTQAQTVLLLAVDNDCQLADMGEAHKWVNDELNQFRCIIIWT